MDSRSMRRPSICLSISALRVVVSLQPGRRCTRRAFGVYNGDPKLKCDRRPQAFEPGSGALVQYVGFRGASVRKLRECGRNILTGPGFSTVNLSLMKNTPAGERLKVQFRVEAFNLFNRTNFDLPDIYVGSPTFGRIH